MTNQLIPKEDNRYRVSRSIKCYVADLMCGTGFCTWYFYETVERTVYKSDNGDEFVVYKGRYYRVQSPEAMKRLVSGHLEDKGCVNIAGLNLHHEKPKNEFTPFHFIDVTTKWERESYRLLKPKWLLENK